MASLMMDAFASYQLMPLSSLRLSRDEYQLSDRPVLGFPGSHPSARALTGKAS